MLKEHWFVKDSIEKTLHNLIAASDVAHLKTVCPAEFEGLLIQEVQFLALYDETEGREVEKYIHQHLPELSQFLHSLAS